MYVSVLRGQVLFMRRAGRVQQKKKEEEELAVELLWLVMLLPSLLELLGCHRTERFGF